MCSISGYKNIKETSDSPIIHNRKIVNKLTKIAEKAENRWKDWIWVFSNLNGLLKFRPFIEKKKEESFSLENFEKENTSIFAYKTDCLLVHNRAIPESEVQNNNTQPIETKNFVVIHNWIIANDKEIIQKFKIEENCPIDTYAFGYLLEELSIEDPNLPLKDLVLKALKEIEGSYAFAIYEKVNKDFMLVTHFQPLSYKFWDDDTWIYFSSLSNYLKTWNIIEDSKIQRLTEYSFLSVDNQNKIETGKLEDYWLREQTYTIEKHISWSVTWDIFEETVSKGLVLASWGLDTCVVAWIMKEDYNCKEMTFLHFDYGHKVENREQKALEDIVKVYWAKYVSIKLDFLKDLFKDSPLLTWNINEDWKWMELNLEYVPVRNALFLMMATSYAEVHWFNYIWFWGNLSESMSYPDTTAQFIEKMNELLPNAIKRNWNIKILDPLKDLLKHEIIAEWLRVKAPMNLSWSCYQDDWSWKHCWKCASCRLREIWMNRNSLDLEWYKK